MQLLLSHLQNWLTLAHLRLTKKLSTMRICGHWDGVRIFSPLRAILRRQSKDACLRSFAVYPICNVISFSSTLLLKERGLQI